MVRDASLRDAPHHEAGRVQYRELGEWPVILGVMTGLVPAIHAFAPATQEGVDARHEAGHDGV